MTQQDDEKVVKAADTFLTGFALRVLDRANLEHPLVDARDAETMLTALAASVGEITGTAFVCMYCGSALPFNAASDVEEIRAIQTEHDLNCSGSPFNKPQTCGHPVRFQIPPSGELGAFCLVCAYAERGQRIADMQKAITRANSELLERQVENNLCQNAITRAASVLRIFESGPEKLAFDILMKVEI